MSGAAAAPVATAATGRRIEVATPTFDAFNVGDVHLTYSRTVTQTHLVNFTAMAGMTLPVFIDHAHAAGGPYGEPIAPGFLTASFSGGMMESILGRNTLAGLGMDGFRFHAPVKAGDTLHAEVEIASKKETKDPARGVIGVAMRVINQRGELVLEYTAKVMMKR
ncbi:MAG: MaoC/PaaZ C-terminal domain-containing protein [Pseudomonadota bacterium]